MTFDKDDPRVQAAAKAMTGAVIGIGPTNATILAIAALTALREHYEANAPAHFVLVMVDPGDNKIQCIKEVRWATNMGLKESKDFVESRMPQTLPRTYDTREEAHRSAQLLTSVGAVVSIEERR